METTAASLRAYSFLGRQTFPAETSGSEKTLESVDDLELTGEKPELPLLSTIAKQPTSTMVKKNIES